MYDLVRQLDRQRFEAIVAVPDDGPFFRRYASLGVPVIPIRVRGGFHVGTVVRLANVSRRMRIDLVHTHGKGAGLYGRLAATLARRPSVHTFHGLHHRSHGRLVGRMYLVAEAALARWTARLIHVSRSEMEEAVQLGISDAGRGRVIANGVDAEAIDRVGVEVGRKRREVGLDPSDVVIGTIARISPQKGLDDLIRAAALVTAQAPRARFLLVGDAPVGDEDVRERLRALAFDLDLEDRVLFAGYRTDAIELLRCMDVYVSSSLWEGLPITLLEAMACGRPVVATDVTGNRDVVVEGQTGLLVPARDPRRLAAAILAVMMDPDLAARFAQEGRRRVEASFALRATVEATEQLYREVLESAAASRLPGVARERTA